MPCICHRERISALSSLVDSRRIVLTHARRSQQLLIFFFFIFEKIQKNTKSRHGGIRPHVPTLVGIRGLPLLIIVHRGDWPRYEGEEMIMIQNELLGESGQLLLVGGHKIGVLSGGSGDWCVYNRILLCLLPRPRGLPSM